jgi:hypothetical protein
MPAAITAWNCARVFSRCTTDAPLDRLTGNAALDGQALAALGAARVDDGTAATRLHADQKAVGAGAAHFGRLVGAFHDSFSGKPMIIPEKRPSRQVVIHAHGWAWCSAVCTGAVNCVKLQVTPELHRQIVFVDKGVTI